MLYAQLDRRLQISQLVSAVVATALEFIGENLFVVEETRNAVGELDLAACACRHGAQVVKYARGEDVAPDDPELRNGRSGRGLFDNARNATHTSIRCFGLDDAVVSDFFGSNRHDANHR